MDTRYAVPALGEQVHYFDPKIPGRVGYPNGMRGRGAGPYLAVVVNELVGGQQLDLAIFKPMAGGGVENVIDVKGPDIERQNKDLPYWDWSSPTQKARAEKRRADAQAKAEAEEAAEEALA